VTERCTERSLSLTGRVRSVAAAVEVRELGFCTGASDHSWDQRVRSGAKKVYRSRGRSDAVACPVASGPLLDSNRTLCVTRPVSSAARPVGASRARALCDRRVWSIRPARPDNSRIAAS
jgi:hypothetical protein